MEPEKQIKTKLEFPQIYLWILFHATREDCMGRYYLHCISSLTSTAVSNTGPVVLKSSKGYNLWIALPEFLQKASHPILPHRYNAHLFFSFSFFAGPGAASAGEPTTEYCNEFKKPQKKKKKKQPSSTLPSLFILALGLNFPWQHIELESDNCQKVWKI